MLVKFISFVITVFGTKRYQPIVFASVALIISVAGVTTVLTTYDAPADTAASTADHADDQTTATLNEQTPATKSLREDATAIPDDTTPNAGAPSTDNTAPTAKEKTVSTTAVQLSSSTVALKAGETSNSLAAATNDATTVQWTITSDPAVDVTLSANSQDNTPSSKTSFTVKATTAGEYKLTIHAKDAARGVDVTKIITLTVTTS